MTNTGSARPLRVVVVDDEETVREGTAMLVRSMGHEAIVFVDALKALEHLGKNTCDVVITDYNMPGMTGVELLKRLKHDVRHEDILVAVQSGDDVRAEVERNDGTFMLKPVDASVFERLFAAATFRSK